MDGELPKQRSFQFLGVVIALVAGGCVPVLGVVVLVDALGSLLLEINENLVRGRGLESMDQIV
jgi:hypothetical protein